MEDFLPEKQDVKSVMEALLRFIQNGKNLALEFVEQAKICHPDGIYLYGAGNHMRFVVTFMRQHQIPIKAILDTYRQGEYLNIPVIRFSEFLNSSPDLDNWFVVSAPSALENILEEMQPYIPREHIFTFEAARYTEYIPDTEEYRKYLSENWPELVSFYRILSDEKSRETFSSVIKGRISGDVSYYRQCYDPIQYYPPDIIHFFPGEVMVELGANNGDTLLEFIQRCPDYTAAYCFEPGKGCHSNLNKIAGSPARGGEIHIIPKGAWDSNTTLRFSAENDAAGDSHIVTDPYEAGTYLIQTTTVDETVKEPITYMKMDIEGAELKALHGAEEQIVKNKPKLAICVYHRPEDFLDIWHYLRQLVPEYQFYLRHHVKYAGVDTVLYAVAEESGR